MAICIVLSSLPLAFIARKVNELSIDKIIVTSQHLYTTYSFLKESYPDLQISKTPSNSFLRLFFYIKLLLSCRLNNEFILIFHECCAVAIDLLLMLIRPRGSYYPQVSMDGFSEVDFNEMPRKKSKLFLSAFKLQNNFQYYCSPGVGGLPDEYMASLKEYPICIQSYDVHYSREVVRFATNETQQSGLKPSVILLMGKTFIDDEIQIREFDKIIEYCIDREYDVVVKDHPNPIYRVNLSSGGVRNIDPMYPSELLSLNSACAIGVSSTSLLNFSGCAISLVNIFDEMTSANRGKVIKHFAGADPEHRINFVDSIDECFMVIEENIK